MAALPAEQTVMSDAPQAVVRELLGSIEDRAMSGDWSEVENLTRRLRGALLDVPEAERRPMILEVQASTEKVTLIALDARTEVGKRINTVRTGQTAAKAYGAR